MSPSDHQWKSFSWKGRGSYVKSNFNQLPKYLITRKNSEPLLKDKLPSRNILTRSISTNQANPSSPVQKNNPKSQLLKILSKSSSNISLIGYSKQEYTSKTSLGEKFNRKTNAVFRTPGKKVALKSKISDIVPHPSTSNQILDEQSKNSSIKGKNSSNKEPISDKSKGKNLI